MAMDPEERKRRKAEYQRRWYAANRERAAQYELDNRERMKERKREYHREWRRRSNWNAKANAEKYGLTVEAYERLLEDNPVCNICSRTAAEAHGDQYPLHVDHCHTTGRVRGLLCRHCNMAVGQFADCPERLYHAWDYLQRDP